MKKKVNNELVWGTETSNQGLLFRDIMQQHPFITESITLKFLF